MKLLKKIIMIVGVTVLFFTGANIQLPNGNSLGVEYAEAAAVNLNTGPTYCGVRVKRIQNALNKWYKANIAWSKHISDVYAWDAYFYGDLVLDGSRGPATKRAVKHFQLAVGLKADSSPGNDTWKILKRWNY